MIKNKFLFSVIVLSCIFSLSYAQSSRTLPFLELNGDVRSAGLGNSFMGESKGMYLYNNPTSSLYEESNYFIGYSYGQYDKNDNGRLSLHVASLGYRYKKNSLFVGFRRFGGLSIQQKPHHSFSKKIDSPQDYSIDLSIARDFGSGISAYVMSSFISSDISVSVSNAAAFSFGAGVSYRNSFDMFNNKSVYVVGLSANNVGPQIQYGASSLYNLPSSASAGGSLMIPFIQNHSLTASFTGSYFFLDNVERALLLGGGLEYTLFDMASLRAGYSYGGNNNLLTLGLGFKVKFVNINMAYLKGNNNGVGDLLRLGVDFAF